jgi:hypothetical protein
MENRVLYTFFKLEFAENMCVKSEIQAIPERVGGGTFGDYMSRQL